MCPSGFPWLGSLQFSSLETSGRLSTNVCTRISVIVWGTSVSYNWFVVMLETMDQLLLMLVTQTSPEIQVQNASAQSS